MFDVDERIELKSLSLSASLHGYPSHMILDVTDEYGYGRYGYSITSSLLEDPMEICLISEILWSSLAPLTSYRSGLVMNENTQQLVLCQNAGYVRDVSFVVKAIHLRHVKNERIHFAGRQDCFIPL